MIKFEHVDFTYEANPEEKSLSNITLEIADGECVILTGESGCGKSTLLRLLNGLIPEFYNCERSGKISVSGTEISDTEIYDFVGKIGTVFQNPRSQFFNVDTTNELAFGCENLAMPENERLMAFPAEQGFLKLYKRSRKQTSSVSKKLRDIDLAVNQIMLLFLQMISLSNYKSSLHYG